MTARDINSPRFPLPPYPDSWYAVAWSTDVPATSAVPVQAFGRELVAFRTTDGVVHVLDAYCPHLGAHLGHGGKVVGDELQCPFHGWRFTRDGRSTPGVGARRECSPLRSWTTEEMHDRVWIWFSSTDAPPAWNLPTTLLDPDVRWGSVGRLDRTASSHPQDIMENAVDAAHFLFIHGMSEVYEADTVYDEHRITTRLRARCSSERMGFKGLWFTGVITIRVYGMGLQTIHTVMRLEKIGIEVDTVVIEGLVPRHAGSANFLIDAHMARNLPPGAAWLARRAFLSAVALDVDADIEIWAHRRFLARPQLTSADSEIMRYRKWARRFYEAASPPLPAEEVSSNQKGA